MSSSQTAAGSCRLRGTHLLNPGFLSSSKSKLTHLHHHHNCHCQLQYDFHCHWHLLVDAVPIGSVLSHTFHIYWLVGWSIARCDSSKRLVISNTLALRQFRDRGCPRPNRLDACPTKGSKTRKKEKELTRDSIRFTGFVSDFLSDELATVAKTVIIRASFILLLLLAFLKSPNQTKWD